MKRKNFVISEFRFVPVRRTVQTLLSSTSHYQPVIIPQCFLFEHIAHILP